MTDTDLSVALLTLGCARNEVDSEELAARLAEGGFRLVADAEDADTVVVNTCGFVEAAKKDSVDTLLQAADLKQDGRTRAVVAVGCLAERYGKELADSLPEADAVLGFDDYPDIAARLRSIVAGEKHHPHTPQDRRRLLPISPAERQAGRAHRPRCTAVGSTPARCPRSSWPAAATGAARSARSRRSAARSSAGGRATYWPRPGGSPTRAPRSCSWSRRTPPPTARTSATCGSSRRCCRRSPRSMASSGCGSPTSSPPRPGRG